MRRGERGMSEKKKYIGGDIEKWEGKRKGDNCDERWENMGIYCKSWKSGDEVRKEGE